MSSTRKSVLILLDLAALYAALALTVLIRYGAVDFSERFSVHLWPFSTLFICWFLSLFLFDLYRQKSLVNYNVLANRLILAVCSAAVASMVLFYLFGDFFRLTPKTNLFIFSLLFTILDYLARTIFRRVAAAWPTAAVLIGNSPRMEEMNSFLSENTHAGYRVTDWVRDPTDKDLDDLPGLIRRTGAATLIVEPQLARDPRVARIIYRLLPLGVVVFNFADFYELLFERVPIEELEEDWFIQHVVARRPLYDRVKRLVDVILSLLLLMALLPIAVILYMIIPLTSRGPAIFAQKRTGRNDRTFTLYKFRSMDTWNGGADGTPAWTLEDDKRVTPFGKFLRATHLDEIPQLWNILRGDISFTGPRPERVELAEEYSGIPYYEMRHVIQPGLTGWAQINYRPSASLEEARVKLAYDIYYVKNRSFLIDLAILLKTVKHLFITPG